jgi:hypothetical protein
LNLTTGSPFNVAVAVDAYDRAGPKFFSRCAPTFYTNRGGRILLMPTLEAFLLSIFRNKI